MAELQEQLQAILGDPEAMGQITAIAKALTGGGSQNTDQAPAQDPAYVPVNTPQDSQAAPDLSALLATLGGGDGPGIDPRLVQIALRLYGEYSAQDDEKAALLAALRPFLRPERQEKLKKAEQIARLSRVVRVAVQLFKEEGDSHV